MTDEIMEMSYAQATPIFPTIFIRYIIEMILTPAPTPIPNIANSGLFSPPQKAPKAVSIPLNMYPMEIICKK